MRVVVVDPWMHAGCRELLGRDGGSPGMQAARPKSRPMGLYARQQRSMKHRGQKGTMVVPLNLPPIEDE